MIITKNFVMLNLPKTGTTFTINVLKKLYNYEQYNLFYKVLYKLKLLKPKLEELKLPNIKMPGRVPDKHGTYEQIPQRDKNKEIVSIIRNPYNRFLSAYKFKAWANIKQLEVPRCLLDQHFPNFPNLSIDEYVDLNIIAEDIRLKQIYDTNHPNVNGIGIQTIQFIQMFFKNPKSVISTLSDDYINSKYYKKDMPNIQFLKQENLNKDLIAFLIRQGFSEYDLEFIHQTKKLNTTKYKTDDIDSLWTQKSLDYVAYRERFLIKIIEDFGINFDKPILNKN